MMKPILHITWEYPPFIVGPLSTHLAETLPKIATRYPTVLVVRGDSDGSFTAEGIKVYKVAQSLHTFPHVLAYAHALNMDLIRGAARAIHENGGVSLVHSHDWISSISSLYISSFLGCPLFISVYTTELTRAQSLKSLLSLGIFDIEHHCFHRADLLIVKDTQMRDHLIENYQIARDKIALGSDAKGILEIYRRVTG
ncbi:MAG: glycosyltransferase [Candidatus Methanomethylicaceae archaeon]